MLPLGLSFAAGSFTRCMQAALSPMQVKGLCVLPYLDDWLVCAGPGRGPNLLIHNTAALLSHVTQLRLTVNHSQSSLTPGRGVPRDGIGLPAEDCFPVVAAGRLLNLIFPFQNGRELP